MCIRDRYRPICILLKPKQYCYIVIVLNLSTSSWHLSLLFSLLLYAFFQYKNNTNKMMKPTETSISWTLQFRFSESTKTILDLFLSSTCILHIRHLSDLLLNFIIFTILAWVENDGLYLVYNRKSLCWGPLCCSWESLCYSVVAHIIHILLILLLRVSVVYCYYIY